MATTYLTLVNNVLRELNETELTSSTFSSSRGIQTAVKDFVNKSIHDMIIDGELTRSQAITAIKNKLRRKSELMILKDGKKKKL